MGLFDKIKEPVFLKNDSEAEQQLAELQKLKETAVGDLAEQLDDEIRQVNAGVYGENAVHFELENSHIPMFVLHDLYLEHDSLTAQIDYLIAIMFALLLSKTDINEFISSMKGAFSKLQKQLHTISVNDVMGVMGFDSTWVNLSLLK